MNNTVDPGTGMIQLKATFPNRDSALWPGQFVNVMLMLTVQLDRVVTTRHGGTEARRRDRDREGSVARR